MYAIILILHRLKFTNNTTILLLYLYFIQLQIQLFARTLFPSTRFLSNHHSKPLKLILINLKEIEINRDAIKRKAPRFSVPKKENKGSCGRVTKRLIARNSIRDNIVYSQSQKQEVSKQQNPRKPTKKRETPKRGEETEHG